MATRYPPVALALFNIDDGVRDKWATLEATNTVDQAGVRNWDRTGLEELVLGVRSKVMVPKSKLGPLSPRCSSGGTNQSAKVMMVLSVNCSVYVLEQDGSM